VERKYARTRPSKGGPCRCDLHQSTMPNALTLENMSPELVKVVERCSHEPHRRKSRMREIRSSGSGEGPGWVTARPTLQRPFPPPAAPLPPARPRAAPTARRGWEYSLDAMSAACRDNFLNNVRQAELS
jgi:hypothetical protein